MEDKISNTLKNPQKVAVTVIETVEEEKQDLQPLTSIVVSSNSKLNVTTSVDSSSPLLVSDSNGATVESQSLVLLPTDQGWAAWRVLCGAILTQGMLFGMLPSSSFPFKKLRLTHISSSIPSYLWRLSRLLWNAPKTVQLGTQYLDRSTQHRGAIHGRPFHDSFV